MNTERIIREYPVDCSLERFAELCGVKKRSPVYEELEDAFPLIVRYAAPKAILCWANVDRIDGDDVTINGVTVRSETLAEKLRGVPRVFLTAVTAGDGLERSGQFDEDPFVDTYNRALIYHAITGMIRTMEEELGFSGGEVLSPGSAPDWTLQDNFSLFDMIGTASEIGITLNPAGYMMPWNSASQIHFSGGGEKNCSLCRDPGCPHRLAELDRPAYARVFGTEA